VRRPSKYVFRNTEGFLTSLKCLMHHANPWLMLPSGPFKRNQVVIDEQRVRSSGAYKPCGNVSSSDDLPAHSHPARACNSPQQGNNRNASESAFEAVNDLLTRQLDRVGNGSLLGNHSLDEPVH